MIIGTVRMAIPHQKRGEAIRILKSVTAQNRVHPGCHSCHIYEDAQEDCVLMFEETWRSEEDLEHHLRSDEYCKVLIVMEMARKRPEIRFDTISVSTGIETAEKARSSPRRSGKP